MYRALCYADVFSFPLTMEEMQRFAIRTWSVQTGVTVSQHSSGPNNTAITAARES